MDHIKDCMCWSCFSQREKIDNMSLFLDDMEDDQHPFWDPPIIYEDGK